jgi:hypothetical protein
MRRQKLKSGWYFDCKCARCCDPTENESFVSATRYNNNHRKNPENWNQVCSRKI